MRFGLLTLLARVVVSWAVVSLGVACGRTSILAGAGSDAGTPPIEQCNDRDDDGDQKVDEDFRDDLGRYVNDANCGSCGRDCYDVIDHATAQGCQVIDDVPVCAAQACEDGYGVSHSGLCVQSAQQLCMPCDGDADCGSIMSATCLTLPGGSYCSIGCDNGCPDGYLCSDQHCLPLHGDCACNTDATFARGCILHAPDGTTCSGQQQCKRGVLSECVADAESCNGIDDDCDGTIDEGFVDADGIYDVDDANCGACGVDCSLDAQHGVALTCGGDPFAPSCVLACADLADGISVGDHVDADRRTDTGCECVVRSMDDPVDPTPGSAVIDDNCDGADGVVRNSYYVATDGDDTGPGSPTKPFRSIGHALMQAAASHAAGSPRIHVFVASGTYTEILEVPGGVQLHGGYRHDFLARNPEGFDVSVVAPPESAAVLGAALVVDAADGGETVIEGLHLRGFDAALAGTPALGVLVRGSSSALTLRDLTVQTGKAGGGASGANGAAAATAVAVGGDGDVPRAAVEDVNHACRDVADNHTRGGASGHNVCTGSDVSGGSGGSAQCPSFGRRAADGAPGVGTNAGMQGEGGTDVSAPIRDPQVCGNGSSVCCGLADFSVPTVYQQATPGADGAAGGDGASGAACNDALGHFAGEAWSGGPSSAGTAGSPGVGGGGGGAGGGVEFAWTDGVCEFADGLGGGGGGGGAGGCGGAGGNAGQSSAPAIGMLLELRAASAAPALERIAIETQPAADGGDGGAGGDGALGGRGGAGGALPRESLATPTLAGAAAGERGGNGGKGGAGGAGGGGCGGSSIGIWVTGIASDAALVERLRGASQFAFGAPGRAGRGGGGAVPAADGEAGGQVDVLVR